MFLNSNKGYIKIIIPIILVIIAIFIIFAMLDDDGKSEALLEIQEPRKYDYFVLYTKNGNAGVIDKKGEILVEPKYKDIYIPDSAKDVFICYNKDDECSILNKDGNKIFIDFDEVTYLETSEATELILESRVLRYKKDGLYGLVDLDENILTEPIYEKITSLKNRPGKILVKQDGLYGVLNLDGKEIIPIKYDSIVGDEFCTQEYGYSYSGYIVSNKTDIGVMYGYIDYSGKEVLDLKYETITRVLEYENSEDIYLVVRNRGKKGVFKNGKLIIDFNYQSINYADKSNIFIVEKTGKYGFCNNAGKEILPVKYTSYQIAGDYISAQENGNTILYDLNGNEINRDKYLSMIEVENSSYFIAVNEAGFYSIISKDVQVNEKYTFITYAFDDNFIFTTEENKAGVLNILKGTVIEPTYSSILNVENSKMLEARDDETGIVDIFDSKLEKVFTVSGGIVENIDENYSVVYSDNQMQYFDLNGKIVDNKKVFPELNLYSICKDDKWGFVDKNGKIIVEPQYDIVTELNEYGFAGIKLNGKWGVIDETGKIVVKPTYQLETYYFPKFVGPYQLELIDTLHCLEVEE